MYRYDAGRVLLALGDTVRARALLRSAARHCLDPREPFRHVHAQYWLGCVLAQTGDRDGARHAFEQVLARWGNAKPRSVTVDYTQRRLASI